MRLLLLISAALLSLPLVSMPTQEELANAEPLVQEVMKAEVDALRSGKKTREQVGDAALALAKAAQAPAEKYLLLTGAFDQYMRGGAYDKAASALDAFLAANNPACAAAAKLEKESAPPAKVADAWWSVVDIRPAFLSSAIRAHAVDLYK